MERDQIPVKMRTTRGGRRPGAGRKGFVEREKVRILKEWDKNFIIHLSQTMIVKALRDKTIPLIDRADLGMRYIAKHTPDQVHNTNVDLSLNDAMLDRLISLMEPRPIIAIEVAQDNNSLTDGAIPASAPMPDKDHVLIEGEPLTHADECQEESL